MSSLTKWGIVEPEEFGKANNDWLSRICEEHDKYGTLQGWTFSGDDLVLVFEHAIFTYSSDRQLADSRRLIRPDEQA